LFEATKVIGQALAINLTKLLDEYWLRKKCFVYVKDKGSNLNAMTTILKFEVCCELSMFGLGLKKFQSTCFGHDFSKACQYVTTYEKIAKI
jgi:hypothetical protein